MKILSAKEAANQTVEFNTDFYEKIVYSISNNIQRAAKNGKHEVVIPVGLKPKELDTLRDLGYTVTPQDETTLINWTTNE